MFKRTLATALLGTSLVGAGLIGGAAVASATPAGATTCPAGSWASTTLGQPTAAHAGVTGAALWRKHNNNVFSLRVSHTNRHVAVFSGTITSDGALPVVARHLEGGDVVFTRSAHAIRFVFTNRGAVDGIDFGALCASHITVALNMNGAKLATNKIVIGAANTNPATNPFSEAKS